VLSLLVQPDRLRDEFVSLGTLSVTQKRLVREAVLSVLKGCTLGLHSQGLTCHDMVTLLSTSLQFAYTEINVLFCPADDAGEASVGKPHPFCGLSW
jgi:hypothetical protein